MTDDQVDSFGVDADDAFLDFLSDSNDPLAAALTGYQDAVATAAAHRVATMGPIDLAALQAASSTGLAPTAVSSGATSWAPPALVAASVAGIVALVSVGVALFNPVPYGVPASTVTSQQVTQAPPNTAPTSLIRTTAASPTTDASQASAPMPSSTGSATAGASVPPVVPSTDTVPPVTTGPVTQQPTSRPSAAPTTIAPTTDPSGAPTAQPTSDPTSTTSPYWNSVQVQIRLALGLINPAGRLPTPQELDRAQTHLDNAQGFVNQMRQTQCAADGTCPPAVATQLTLAQRDIDAARTQLNDRRGEI